MTAPSYYNTLLGLFGPVQTFVQSTRAWLGLQPLQPNGLFLFGQEQLRHEHSPPRIVIVPVGATYSRTRRMSQNGANPTGTRSDLQPQVIMARLQKFQAHIWGDPTTTPSTPPSQADILSDFDAAVEMERELIDGMRQFCGNTFNIHIESSEFRQPTDDTRLGRLLVLHFSIETQVPSIPDTALANANPGVPGSSFVTNLDLEFDGSSTIAGVIQVPQP
jgi:hypothetical protein